MTTAETSTRLVTRRHVDLGRTRSMMCHASRWPRSPPQTAGQPAGRITDSSHRSLDQTYPTRPIATTQRSVRHWTARHWTPDQSPRPITRSATTMSQSTSP